MSDRLQNLRIFVCSPGDVPAERQIAFEVIELLQYEPPFRDSVYFDVVAWDKPGAGKPSSANERPQAAISAGLLSPADCDIVIVVFWSRMGPSLPFPEYQKDNGEPYYSGAESVFEAAVHSNRQYGRPDILVYRRTQKALLDDDAPEYEQELAQKNLLKKFFDLLSNAETSADLGGYTSYEKPEEFRRHLTAHLRTLAEKAMAKGATSPMTNSLGASASVAPQRPADWPGSPFPGPRAFTKEDAPIFFGRGREIDDLTDRIDHDRFVTVVGASGSGKSSLVWAGLIPRLEAGAIKNHQTASTDWLWLRLTPGSEGSNPFMALAVKLQPFLPDLDSVEIAHKLEADPEALTQLIPQLLSGRSESSELLLFIDNLEELVTVVSSNYRAPFTETLCRAVAGGRCRGVGTLRADFYHQMIPIGGALVELLKRGSYPLGAPDAMSLHEMVRRPAERGGVRFENNLDVRIVQETGSDPEALSLLAYLLDELYRKRVANGHLTQRAYDDLGGVAGAIGNRAEQIYQTLSPAVQTVLPQMFLHLVEVDEYGAPRRRRMLWEKIGRSAPADVIDQLFSAFIEARLLVTDKQGGKRTIELAHEALLRKWGRLANWIEQKREDLRLLRRVKLAAAEWDQNARQDALRWPDDRLKPVHAVAQRLELDEASEFSATERDFISREYDRTLEEINNPNTPHIRRSWIGERLCVIGDARPHVGLRPSDGLPDIDWCKVDVAGKSWVEVEIEGGSFVKVYLPFYIARFPVTYSQFQAFIEAPDGYSNRGRDWFDGLAADSRDKQLEEQHFKFPNHPREMVNWYQAMAFCRWLSWRFLQTKAPPSDSEGKTYGPTNPASKVSGSKGGKTSEFNLLDPFSWPVRLPTEAEWQFAAAGPLGKKFPWGQYWDPRLANTLEGCLSRTTAVGMYPAGKAACGALDMSGNVWEWTLTEYSSGKSDDITNAEPRAGRGGSWIHNWSRARTAARGFSVNPDYRFDSGGFRLLAVAPSP